MDQPQDQQNKPENANTSSQIPAKPVPLASEIKDESLEGVTPNSKPTTLNNIPEEVALNIQRDRKNYYSGQNVLSETKVDLEKPSRPKSNFFEKYKTILISNNKYIKIAGILTGLLFGCFVILILSYITGIDTAFFKITLEGKITDEITGESIADAKITIDENHSATTDKNGVYKIPGLNQQYVKVNVEADGYLPTSKDYPVTRGILDYSSTLDIKLQPAEKGNISGKFISNISNYNFIGDKLILNDKEFAIDTDGSFNISNLKSGKLALKFQSRNFKDIEKNYTINSGANKLEDIVLEPAGDIEGELKSYVSEDLVLGTQFDIENVASSQIVVEENGDFIIKDLDVGRKYKIRVTAEGYVTRDYEVDIKQGENKIFNFRLVEKGSAIFLRKVDRDNQFFKSDFDGINATQLTNIARMEPYSWKYNSLENILYFASTHERIRTNYTDVKIVYSVNLNDNSFKKVTSNTSSLGALFHNFTAKKMVNVTEERISSSQRKYTIEVMDLEGNNRKEIRTIENAQIFNIIISDDGNNVFFTEIKDNQPSLYRYSITNSELKLINNQPNISLFDTTRDGNRVLYSRKNNTTGFQELVVYYVNENETRTIDENIDGFAYQFIRNSNDEIIYYTQRDGRSNVFKLIISQNKDEKITNLSSEYNILGISQQDNYLTYLTNRGLLILNISKPRNFKTVTQDVVIPN